MKTPKLKLTMVVDDRPVKLAVELPAAVHRDLIAYAEILSRETGQAIADQRSSLRRCSPDSWRRIGRLRKPVGRGRPREMEVDSARP